MIYIKVNLHCCLKQEILMSHSSLAKKVQQKGLPLSDTTQIFLIISIFMFNISLSPLTLASYEHDIIFFAVNSLSSLICVL